MKIAGLVFVGTRTGARGEMASFAREVLGLAPADPPELDADLFDLPDGSSFAVAPSDEPRGQRTVGFLVEDLDAAAAELRSAGIPIDGEVAANERFRYVHFRAPDGLLYELVELRLGRPIHQDPAW